VRPAEKLRGVARCSEPVRADIRAEVDKDVAAQCHDRAVALARDLDVAIHLPRMVHPEQMLAAILDPPHWPPDMPGGKRDQGVLGVTLAARSKAAADIVLDQVDRRFGEAQHCREGAAVEKWDLRGTHHGQAAGHSVPFGEQPARLHRQCGVTLYTEALPPRTLPFSHSPLRI